MLLSGPVRTSFMKLIYVGSRGRFSTVYSLFYDPKEGRAAVKEIMEYASKHAPKLYERKITAALATINQMLLDLERELESPSPELLEIAEAVLTDILTLSGNNAALTKALKKNFHYVSRIIPFDVTDTKGNRSFIVLRPTKSDMSTIIYEFIKETPQDAVENLVENVTSNSMGHSFVHMMRKLAGRLVEIDIGNRTVVVGGKKFDVEEHQVFDVIARLARGDYMLEYVSRVFGKEIEEVSRSTGIELKIKSVSLDGERALITLESAEGSQTRLKIEVVCEPLDIISTLRVHYGDKAVYYEDVRWHPLDQLPEYLGRLLKRDRIEETVAIINEVASILESSGYSIVSMTALTLSKIVVEAYKDRSTLKYWIYVDDAKGELELNTVNPRVLLSYKEWHYDVDGIPVDVIASNGRLQFIAGEVPLSSLPHFIEYCGRIADELAKEVRARHADMTDEDALILYIIQQLKDRDVLIRHELSPQLVSLRAGRAAVRACGLPARVLARKPQLLYDYGLLSIDEDGYVRIFGRRLEDVSERYLSDRLYGAETEKALLSTLLLSRGVSIFSKGIPRRIESFLLFDAKEVMPEKAVRRILLDIAGRRDLWESLTPNTKLLIAVQLGDELFTKAKANNWDWITGDWYLALSVHACKAKNPSEITRIVAEKLPEVLSGAELVTVGGEYFIKHKRTYMQVREVQPDGFLFQGTIQGYRVGMVVKARNADEASDVIQSELLDCIIEFKEALSEYGDSVSAGSYQNPLFHVPYVTIASGTKRITVPLQRNFKEKLRSATCRLAGGFNEEQTEKEPA